MFDVKKICRHLLLSTVNNNVEMRIRFKWYNSKKKDIKYVCKPRIIIFAYLSLVRVHLAIFQHYLQSNAGFGSSEPSKLAFPVGC